MEEVYMTPGKIAIFDDLESPDSQNFHAHDQQRLRLVTFVLPNIHITLELKFVHGN
jgi:hypothetical protein